MLHPLGYHRGRSRNELIADLQAKPTETSARALQNIEAVRRYLAEHFALDTITPPDNRFLYGYDDAHWLLWSLVDPIGREAAVDYLPH